MNRVERTVVVSPEAAPEQTPADTNNCVRSYDWKSDSVSLEIWDGWTIDGDVVSLSVAGRTLLEHSKLSEDKRRFLVALNHGLSVITISLHEEGFEPPNTPNLVLYDRDETYRLNVSGGVGQTVRICLWHRN